MTRALGSEGADALDNRIYKLGEMFTEFLFFLEKVTVNLRGGRAGGAGLGLPGV